MITAIGLLCMVAAACSLFVAYSVVQYMPTKWLKIGVLGMLFSGAASLFLRGLRLTEIYNIHDGITVGVASLYSVAVIIVFLCVTGKLNGHSD